MVSIEGKRRKEMKGMAGRLGKGIKRGRDGGWQLCPLLPVALCMATGIVAGEAIGRTVGMGPDSCMAATAAATSAATTVTSFVAAAAAISFVAAVAAHRLRMVQSVLIFVLMMLLGATSSLLDLCMADKRLPAGRTVYKAVVTSVPQQRGNSISCDLLMTAGEMAGRKVRASFALDSTMGNTMGLQAGDGLTAASVMRYPRNFGNGNFDYVKYLWVHGIGATTFVARNGWRKSAVDVSGLGMTERARLGALRLRGRLVEAYRKEGIGGDELAVTAALTLGDRSMVDRRLRDDYSASGGAHVLAMSGMHLSVIYAMMVLLMAGSRQRLLAQVAATVTVWAFVFVAGMSPSLLRSALMLTVFAFVTLLNRSRMSLNALALAAIVMMAANPRCIHDVGFQMSFMAVLSILLVLPTVEGWAANGMGRNWLARRAWGMAALAVVAQLGVMPLVAFYYGRIPCYFLLTNFIVVPCVTVLLYSAVAFFVVVPLRPVTAWLLKAVAGAMNGSLQFIASLPGASIEGVSISGWQVFLVYVLLFLIFLLLKRVIVYKV